MFPCLKCNKQIVTAKREGLTIDGSLDTIHLIAGVVKLVDTGDLKSPGPNTAVRVQVPSPAKRYDSICRPQVARLSAISSDLITEASKPD